MAEVRRAPPPTACPDCAALVAYKNMSRHRRKHEGERRFACTAPACDRAFARADTLARHAQTHGMRTAARFPCTHAV
jgi:hypothetical protein